MHAKGSAICGEVTTLLGPIKAPGRRAPAQPHVHAPMAMPGPPKRRRLVPCPNSRLLVVPSLPPLKASPVVRTCDRIAALFGHLHSSWGLRTSSPPTWPEPELRRSARRVPPSGPMRTSVAHLRLRGRRPWYSAL